MKRTEVVKVTKTVVTCDRCSSDISGANYIEIVGGIYGADGEEHIAYSESGLCHPEEPAVRQYCKSCITTMLDLL